MALSTILLILFIFMFWFFRVIVALCTQFSVNLIGIISYNLEFEIIISFVILFCIVLIIKRKLIGALLYSVLYVIYFGKHLLSGMISIFNGVNPTIEVSTNLVCDLCAILLVFFCLLDIIADKNRKKTPKDRNTDWYFNNKDYDEEIKKRDPREDKNNYKYY